MGHISRLRSSETHLKCKCSSITASISLCYSSGILDLFIAITSKPCTVQQITNSVNFVVTDLSASLHTIMWCLSVFYKRCFEKPLMLLKTHELFKRRRYFRFLYWTLLQLLPYSACGQSFINLPGLALFLDEEDFYCLP